MSGHGGAAMFDICTGRLVRPAFALGCLVCIAFVFALPVPGNTGDVSGVVSGYVYDYNNHPLESARLSLRSSDTPESVSTSSHDGFFTFMAVLPGKYFVLAEYPGKHPCSVYFEIFPNQVKAVRFRLPEETKVPWVCRYFERAPSVSF
jgi:Carboxypeptidase regulatory-like domain